VPGWQPRLWGWNKDQLTTVQFTPAAHVPIPQLEKIDWAVVVVVPSCVRDFCLSAINLDERSRPNNRKHRVIFFPDVSVERIPQIHVLKQADGNFFPIGKHPGD